MNHFQKFLGSKPSFFYDLLKFFISEVRASLIRTYAIISACFHLELDNIFSFIDL